MAAADHSLHAGTIKLMKPSFGFIASPDFAADVFFHASAAAAAAPAAAAGGAALSQGDAVLFSLSQEAGAPPGRLVALHVQAAPAGTAASIISLSPEAHVGRIAAAAAPAAAAAAAGPSGSTQHPEPLGLLRYYEDGRVAQLTYVSSQGLHHGQPLPADTVVRFRIATDRRQQRVAAASRYGRHAVMQAVQLAPLTPAEQAALPAVVQQQLSMLAMVSSVLDAPDG
jgi:cold shock CspA family protein